MKNHQDLVHAQQTAAWSEEFLHAKIGQGLSVRTIEAYRARVGRFTTWLGDRPVTRQALYGYRAALHDHEPALSATTIASYVRDVSVFCAWLVAEEKLLDSHGQPITRNPAHGLIPKTPKRFPASYSKAQCRKLLDGASPRDKAIILVLLDTGLRASELLSLRRDDIDWGSGQFRVVGKGNKERTGWLSQHSRDALAMYLFTRTDDSPAMWVGKRGPLTKEGVHRAIERRAEAAGMRTEVRRLVHAFRATFAKNYLRRGGDLKSLADLLGHTTLTMAAHYGQLSREELAHKKAAVDPLAAILEGNDQ